MDILSILKELWLIISTPIIAVVGYQQYQIRNLQSRVDIMIERKEVRDLLIEIALETKEKIEDKISPVASRLDRIECKLDQLLLLDHRRND